MKSQIQTELVLETCLKRVHVGFGFQCRAVVFNEGIQTESRGA